MPHSLTRRSFLGSTATAGIALGMTSTKSYGSILGANDKIVLAMIGTGSRGTELSKAFAGRPGVEIAYVCDVDKRRVDKAAATVAKVHGSRSPKTVDDFRPILQDKSVDAVVIATCNHWHAPVAIMACKAGKHVYVEKPCSHNPHEGELMVATAQAPASRPDGQSAPELASDGHCDRARVAAATPSAEPISPNAGTPIRDRRSAKVKRWRRPRSWTMLFGKARRRIGHTTIITCITTGIGSGTGAMANLATTAFTSSICAGGDSASIFPSK